MLTIPLYRALCGLGAMCFPGATVFKLLQSRQQARTMAGNTSAAG